MSDMNPDGDIHDVKVVEYYVNADIEVLATMAANLNEHTRHPDAEKGVVDTACAKTVCGDAWWNDYFQALKLNGLEQQVTEVNVRERFRFGDGRRVDSSKAHEFPAAT